MRVFKIDTELTDSENKALVKNISEDDANFLSSLDIKVSVDLLDENDKLTTIMVTNILNLEKLKTYFTRSNIECQIEDITQHFTGEQDENVVTKILEDLTYQDILKSFGVEI
jgi:hypothetical protein